MLVVLVWIGVGSATAIEGPIPSQGADCPKISVICGEPQPDETIPLTFSASVIGGKPTREVTYCWTVVRGAIKRGQGTKVLEVEAKGRDRQALTALVNIGGFDPKCAHTASCSTAIP